MRAYVDTSVLVSLLTRDAHSGRADTFVETETAILLVSDLAAAEFASVVARRIRTREMLEPEARAAFRGFDRWSAELAERVETSPADIRRAVTFLRGLDLTLRTQDAIHIATAVRLDAALATFDSSMADAARALGVTLAAV